MTGELSPDDRIFGVANLTVGQFWAWAYSDILSNRNRSIFAEFLVGAALGVLEKPRVEWDAVDLRYHGKGIEVKSAAYRQSWTHDNPSKILFRIGESLGWDAATNTFAVERIRSADCYVFCLYSETEAIHAREHLLDVNFWQFYVLSTSDVTRHFGKQKSIALSRFKHIKLQPVGYSSLRSSVEAVLQDLEMGNE